MPLLNSAAPNRARDAVPVRHKSRFSASIRRTAVTAIAAVGLVLAGLAGTANPAYAAEYPSWDDVQNAMNNESLKATEVTNITNLIAGLQANVEATQAASVAAGDAYYTADQEFLLADYQATEIQTQADNESATATDASTKVGQVASQLYRNGGDDTALKLLFSEDGEDADELLNQLGQMDKLMERNQTVYTDAVKATKSAQSLSDQAQVARDERDRLKIIAEAAFVEAQNAAVAAADALTAQQANLMTLEAQLSALQSETATVTTQYEIGVEERRKAAEAAEAARIEAARAAAAQQEADRIAREEAERIAREEAANRPTPANPAPSNPDPPVTSPGGGGSSAGTGGWVRPSNGARTSDYGPRYSQCGPNYCASGFHKGVDMASGCGSAIFAAQSGTVNYAGENGGYGNYIRIDHGGGVGTGYGHIQYGGILVSNGQWVNAGDLIALEGQTGNSFGCHVHYEVYIWGSAVNPADYMSNRGIWL